MRHAFDTFEVPFDLIYKERVRKGDLRAAYDVILIPNQGRDGQGPGLRHRLRRRKPLPYTKTDAVPDRSASTASRTTSPAAWASRASLELQKFVEAGGVLDHAGRGELRSRRSSA